MAVFLVIEFTIRAMDYRLGLAPLSASITGLYSPLRDFEGPLGIFPDGVQVREFYGDLKRVREGVRRQ